MLLRTPWLLLYARALLIEPLAELCAASRDALAVKDEAPEAEQPVGAVGIGALWWAARCAMVHQRCLLSAAPSLEELTSRCMRETVDALLARGEASGQPFSFAGGTGGAEWKGLRVMVTGVKARPELNGASYQMAEARRLKGTRGMRTLLPTKNCIHGLRGRLGSSRSCATRLR